MARKKPRGPLYEWEQAMIDAYYDHRCHETLDPLYEKFGEWHEGQVSHADIDAAIHFVHREMQKIYSQFSESRIALARSIVNDTAWYDRWLREHPLPDDE